MRGLCTVTLKALVIGGAPYCTMSGDVNVAARSDRGSITLSYVIGAVEASMRGKSALRVGVNFSSMMDAGLPSGLAIEIEVSLEDLLIGIIRCEYIAWIIVGDAFHCILILNTLLNRWREKTPSLPIINHNFPRPIIA